MSVGREEAELVQVLAVGVASLETMKFGQAAFEAWFQDERGPQMQGFEILDRVADERMRQDRKWGEQRHGRVEWAMILAEEIGEWAEEIGPRDPDYDLSEVERSQAEFVLRLLASAGESARAWLENHEWPDRQQSVYDEELAGEEI